MSKHILIPPDGSKLANRVHVFAAHESAKVPTHSSVPVLVCR